MSRIKTLTVAKIRRAQRIQQWVTTSERIARHFGVDMNFESSVAIDEGVEAREDDIDDDGRVARYATSSTDVEIIEDNYDGGEELEIPTHSDAQAHVESLRVYSMANGDEASDNNGEKKLRHRIRGTKEAS